MTVPGQRGAGQRGGKPRGNIRTFKNAGGRVPPPPNKPTVSGKGGWGCPLSVAVPVLVVTAVVLAACHL